MTEPIKTLIISTTMNIGGAQRFTSNLLAKLDRDRIQPSLCLLRDETGFDIPDDVPVTAFDYQRGLDLFKTVKRLQKLIEQTSPDVVLSNVSATSIVAGRAINGLKGKKPAWIARVGSDPAQHVKGIRRLLLNGVYPLVDRFVVNSHGLVDGMCAMWPFARECIDVIHNPTDFERLDQLAGEPTERDDDSRPLIVAVGRVSQPKRYDVMLRAFARVREKVDARLWFFGDVPMPNKLESLVVELNLNDTVRFWGHVANPFCHFKNASLFCMSSDYEGLPNALIEAQGMGLPAVSTNCRYGPDEIIIDKATGLLVPVRDPEAMANAIAELLQDQERRVAFGKRARENARARFSAGELTRQWEETIIETANNKKLCQSK